MEHKSSSEANSSSASQKIRLIYETRMFNTVFIKETITCPYSEPDESSPRPYNLFLEYPF